MASASRGHPDQRPQAPARRRSSALPRIGLIRPTRQGFQVSIRLHKGQTPEDYVRVLDKLAHAWRVHWARLASWEPGRIVLVATLTDPLAKVPLPAAPDGLLRVRVGRLETGGPWVIDFRTVPHWLNRRGHAVGQVQPGQRPDRRPGAAAGGAGRLRPQRRGGVHPVRAPAVRAGHHPGRMRRAAGRPGRADRRPDGAVPYRRVHATSGSLPAALRPVPVVVLVDEVAELYLMADKSEKEEIAKTCDRAAAGGPARPGVRDLPVLSAASGSAPTSGPASPRCAPSARGGSAIGSTTRRPRP